MNFSIREGKIEDMPAVLNLIKELAHFEKEPEAVVVTVADLETDGFGNSLLFKTFVAELDNEIVGMAFFYPRYSTWKGPTIHLEDLIVKKNKRGLNIGTTAIEFYKKTGGHILEDWKTVQMNEQAIKNYLETL